MKKQPVLDKEPGRKKALADALTLPSTAPNSIRKHIASLGAAPKGGASPEQPMAATSLVLD